MELGEYSNQLNLDQLTIDTPEHVALRLPVAGVGSRFLAIFIDTLIQIVAYILLILALVLLSSGVHASSGSSKLSGWAEAVLIFLHFLAYWGYFTLFEGLWHGQTPGKRLFKLRVIKDTGRQIGFVESMARNLLRIVDVLPGMYLVGILTVIFNPQRKRLGDMVAGTLVVHDEELTDPSSIADARIADASLIFTVGLFAPASPEAAPSRQTAWFPANAIARLGSNDQVVLDTFFARIPDLDVVTKQDIERRLLATLCAKMGVAIPEGANPRALLDFIAWELRNQAGFRTR